MPFCRAFSGLSECQNFIGIRQTEQKLWPVKDLLVRIRACTTLCNDTTIILYLSDFKKLCMATRFTYCIMVDTVISLCCDWLLCLTSFVQEEQTFFYYKTRACGNLVIIAVHNCPQGVSVAVCGGLSAALLPLMNKHPSKNRARGNVLLWLMNTLTEHLLTPGNLSTGTRPHTLTLTPTLHTPSHTHTHTHSLTT